MRRRRRGRASSDGTNQIVSTAGGRGLDYWIGVPWASTGGGDYRMTDRNGSVFMSVEREAGRERDGESRVWAGLGACLVGTGNACWVLSALVARSLPGSPTPRCNGPSYLLVMSNTASGTDVSAVGPAVSICETMIASVTDAHLLCAGLRYGRVPSGRKA
ncbi:uncharacterized protein J3D65DRAFT_141323 [Phyllosticta citribraziliensis]|uniref:Uncharacterized protein n=1 Tax=Phyllosticta citribraziliensis TaxID=989973 RepID=A0ABR1LAP2_9PEZI